MVAVPANLGIRLRTHSPDVNVRLEVRDTNDSIWRVADAPGLRSGIDLIYLEPGPQRWIDLRLVSVDEMVAAGDVLLVVEALPAQGRRDSVRIEAVRTESEACAAIARKEGGDSEAAELFAAAARDYERAGSREEAAVATYHEAAALYYSAGDWEEAAELASKAAGSASRLGPEELAGHSIALEGAALIESAGNLPRDRTGEAPAIFDRSRLRLLEAAGRFERLGLTYHRAYAINYRGVAYHYQGLWDEADAEYEKAAHLFRQAGSQRAEAMSLQNRALLAYERGNYPDAIARFDDALRLHSEAGEEESYAHALHNSALAAQAIGNYDEAIRRFHHAATMLRSVGDAAGEARALHGLGVTFKVAGEPDRARALLEQAVPLRKAARDRRGLLTTLIALGDVERMQGRIDEATALHREALSSATSAQERNWALLGLGRDLVAGGEEIAALETFDAVIKLPLPESHPGKGHAYLERASLIARRDGYVAAAPDFDRALAIHASNGADVATADAFQRRASARLLADLVEDSLADADRALAILERTGLEGIHADLRAEFLGARRDAYEIRIAALLQQARVAREADDEGRARELEQAAFATSERSRARQLLDAMASRSATDDELPESSERAELYGRLVGKMARRDALLDRPDHNEQVVAQLARDIELLRTEIDTVESRLAQQRQGDRTGASGADSIDLPQLPADTVLAEYFTGSDRAWLFLMNGDALAIHELPKPDVLEDWVRTQFDGWRRPSTLATWPPSGPVADALLSPLRAVPRSARLWIAGDGPLHYLPLALFADAVGTDPRDQVGSDPADVVLIPSLQVVGRSRDHSTRERPVRLMAVVADPVFGPGDARLASLEPQSLVLESTMLASLIRGGERLQSLQRLPATAVEADGLRKLVTPESSIFLTGLDASRDRVLATPLGEFRILHFATHAFSDLSDPALSMLVLSQLDRSGHPQEGALRGYDIASLHLNADLVVLSACETAVGKHVSGEGLLGLSHAFLQAGARTVLASLWQVPDAATAVLMREFYHQLLDRRVTPTQALQLAQKRVASEMKWRSPYYWAGLQITSSRPASIQLE